MSPSDPVTAKGSGRLLPGPAGTAALPVPANLAFADDGFTLQLGPDTRMAAYRDVETIAVQQGTVLLVLGTGAGAERVLLEGFGDRQGLIVRELRDRRFRQRMSDAFIEAPATAIPLVQYAAGTDTGVAQLAYHPWGAVLAPIDERRPWIAIRRRSIGDVQEVAARGEVTIALDLNTQGTSGGTSSVQLLGLGEFARVHADSMSGLRDAAHADAGRLIAGLIPDATYGARQLAARLLVDGRPADPSQLADAWPAVEAGVLVDPDFAASYHALVARAARAAARPTGGAGVGSSVASEPSAAPQWLAMSPMQPGGDEARSWFLVGLPGNLVALELVSAGAHATYCFRVIPRATFDGTANDPADLAAAVFDVSEALVDSRFLREPMALPDDVLGQPQYLRYRLALRALPTLASARARFVARLVHRDTASWGAALDDLIAWHGASRDDTAIWPGRAAQEAEIDEAQAGDDAGGPAPDAGAAGAPGNPIETDSQSPGGA